MASKRKTREQKRVKRLREKRNASKKKEKLRALTLKQFETNFENFDTKYKRDFGEDNFEFILAEEQHQSDRRRDILFRRF